MEKDLNFKRELERLLYENKDLLTTNSLTVSGKPAEPTIGNWLKDFIDKKGTGDFNTIALSDYMTNSANTKNLTQDEKRKLFDLFNLYRNIKFFPPTSRIGLGQKSVKIYAVRMNQNLTRRQIEILNYSLFDQAIDS